VIYLFYKGAVLHKRDVHVEHMTMNSVRSRITAVPLKTLQALVWVAVVVVDVQRC
jgi:hypothetical protein